MLGVPYFLGFAVLVAAVAAAFDWRTGNIPNWLTLGPLCAAPVAHAGYHLAIGRSAEALHAAGFSVLGAAVCGVVPWLFFRQGAIGGGDVKLLAALGAICRPMLGLELQFYAYIAAAVFAPARLA